MKVCGKCRIEKPTVDFGKNKNSPDGLQGYCKECTKEYKKKYRESNPNYDKDYNEKNRPNKPRKVRVAKVKSMPISKICVVCENENN